MTVEMGFSSTRDFPLLSALTIALNASFKILLPISYSTQKTQDLRPNFLYHSVVFLRYRENSNARLVEKEISKWKLIITLPMASLNTGEADEKTPNNGGAMVGSALARERRLENLLIGGRERVGKRSQFPAFTTMGISLLKG